MMCGQYGKSDSHLAFQFFTCRAYTKLYFTTNFINALSHAVRLLRHYSKQTGKAEITKNLEVYLTTKVPSGHGVAATN